jgi:acyl-CoA synthetase (AMP-forming)/AMP-acid ligase II
MMRHGDLLFNNKLAIYAHSLRHEDVHLLVLPMFHATALYSLLPTSALLGSTIVLAPRTDIRYLVELVQEHRISTFFGVPTLFHFLTMMKDLDKYDLSSLRVLAYAGSPMPPVTIKRLREKFPKVMLHNFFGLTETISMTHVLPSKDADTKPESIGKLLPHVCQRILDEEGNEVPPGQVGRLYFHRSNVISGYWKEPDRLPQSMKGDWFDTGDLAMVDEDGFVFLKGRSKDMIIVGGENVYALEVENCIMTLEKVREAAVIGVPATGVRAYLGELVKAIVVPHENVELTAADIKKHCMERLASYKVPQFIDFRKELPRNPSGKVLKRLLS